MIAFGQADPHFAGSPYEFWVAGSVPVDTSIGQVQAVGFLEHDVRYLLKHNLKRPGIQSCNSKRFAFFCLGVTSSSYCECIVPLSIDPRTGVLRVTEDLSGSPGVTYSLNVTASDGHRESITTAVTVHVSTTQARSAGPAQARLEPDPAVPPAGPSVLKFEVMENAPASPIGTLVYPVKTKKAGQDGVQAVDATRSFRFAPADHNAAVWDLFRVLGNGTVFTRKPLDREQTGSSLTLAVTVRENDKAVAALDVVVTVLDANDNPPTFGRTHYVGRVAENATAGIHLQ